MFCDFLKWFLREAAEVALVMTVLVIPASAQEYTSEQSLLCDAKMTVAEYAYRNRNVKPKRHMFEALDFTWKERWTSLHYASYVDMRRIINEAYRINSGKHRHDACEKGQESICEALIKAHMQEECRESLHYGF